MGRSLSWLGNSSLGAYPRLMLHAPSDQTLRVLDLVGLTKHFTIT